MSVTLNLTPLLALYTYISLAHCYTTAGGNGDPHLHFPPTTEAPNGRRADFRGQPDTAFNLLSAPNISFAGWVSKSDFHQKYGKQLVHGTHFTKVRQRGL